MHGAAIRELSVKPKLINYLVCPKGKKKNHKNKCRKMDGLCFPFNALLTVHGVENVCINRSFLWSTVWKIFIDR